MNTNNTYHHFDACEQLSEYVHSFWAHINPTNEIETSTFAPDGFFKIIIIYQNNQIVRYFITGIVEQFKEIHMPPNSIGVGCRFKILAPEYLLGKSVANLINKEQILNLDLYNVRHFDVNYLDKLKIQWEKELLKTISNRKPNDNKLRLSKLLYESKGTLSVTQVSDQIYWEQRQINRYLNKYLGISLKTYLNIQRAYSAYFDIKQGKLSPTQDAFHDQSHFIKEIKKHTGASPKEIFQNQNNTFKQIRNIKKK